MKDKVTINNGHYSIFDYDDRFKKVKIFVAHTGENLNQSSFSLQALQKMSRTLPYVPIVGYLTKDEYGNVDFKGHESVIEIVDDELRIDYLGVPFGFIPENPKIDFEFREGKEWLTVEGYLWNKFEKYIKTIEKANGRKSQSMEIINVVGYVDDTDVLHIENGEFSALCILGDNVQPAMVGSTLEMFTANNSFKDEIKEMIYEFTSKGDVQVDKEIKEHELEQEVDKVEKTEEVVEDTTEKVEQPVVDEEVQEKDNEVVEDVEEKDTTTDEVAEEESETEHDKELEEDKKDETEENDDLVAQELEENEEDIIEDNHLELSAQLKSLQESYSLLEKEVEELREFKFNVEVAKKEALIESYQEELTKEELEDFKAKMNEFSYEQLDKEIVYTIFNKNRENSTSKVFSRNANNVETESVFGAYGRFFK